MDVSLELLTKVANWPTLSGAKLEAVAIGHNISGIEKELAEYGADTVWVADGEETTLTVRFPLGDTLRPVHAGETADSVDGATPVGRDLGPRVSSALHSGLTADCTSLL